MIPLYQETSSQPQTLPDINWKNPISAGLMGLMWMGPGGPVDLITNTLYRTAGATLNPSQNGLARTRATAGTDGIYSERWINTTNPWMQTSAVTCAYFGNHTTPAGSRAFAGAYDGNSLQGYKFFDVFGTRSRLIRIVIGGANKDVSAGTWADKDCVRAVTYNGATVVGYDDGLSFASTATTGNITYDATWTRTVFLGDPGNSGVAGRGYWMGCWNRALSASEIADLNKNPWQLFSLPQYFPLSISAGGGPTIFTITPSGGIAFAGAISTVKTDVIVPSGGVTFAGAVTLLRTKQFEISGGIVFGGAVDEIRIKVVTPSGVINFGGTGGMFFIPAGGTIGGNDSRFSIGASRSIGVS